MKVVGLSEHQSKPIDQRLVFRVGKPMTVADNGEMRGTLGGGIVTNYSRNSGLGKRCLVVAPMMALHPNAQLLLPIQIIRLRVLYTSTMEQRVGPDP